MVSGQAVLIVLGVAFAWFLGVQTIAGVKWIGKEVKKGGAAVVHVLKKIPHPHRDAKDPSA